VMPVYAAVFMIMTMSSIGLPALNGFIGEIMILQGVFVANKVWAAFAASGIVLGAAYMLWLYQRTMFGKLDKPENQALKDLNFRESMTLIPLVVLAFWIGLYPKPFFDILQPSVQRIVQQVSATGSTSASVALPAAGTLPASGPVSAAASSPAESVNE